ncbi:MAG: PQQ-binding-like beta-propeller repeat protein [Euryarchaeota archaeon]|nr:PQQ-binding-like beta-propeller repeat protein [Euryarchaeota archaeon]
MKRKIIGKNAVIIWIVLLLLLSSNLSAIVSSGPAEDRINDGVWFDDLDNDGNISKNVNCVVSNGSVKLDYGSNIRYYDYVTGNNEAWSSDLSFLTGGAEEFIWARSLVNEVKFGDNYSAIKHKKDSKVEETQSRYFDNELLNYTFSPVHHFRLKIDQNKNVVNEIKFAWYGTYKNDANIEDINMYVWDYSYLVVDRWINVGTKTYDHVIGNSSNGDIIFTSDENGSNYIGKDGSIDFLVIATPKNNGKTCILTTDYVNLTVTTQVGYLGEGYIISDSIEPSTLGRWESVVWSGSRATGTSSVKIQLLNSAEVSINNSILPGNSQGFTVSPLDLSSFPGLPAKIKLKAILHSSDLSITPKLYSWGVTWQTINSQFKDDFTTDLRIDKIVGAKIVDDIISISDFYSSWPIFGKNPANTRYYEGYGPQTSSLYWTTEKETVGGGFRSPVMSDGKIYIASSADKRIYSFNAIGSSNKKTSFDSSDQLRTVDSSVAVTDSYVIVATSELNTSETNAYNKIYALDKSNLKNEVWNYSSVDEEICFSSSPTVANDKVFVTSWNGQSWDTPLLSFLRLLIGGNNKIIVLNLADGSLLWENDLPAGSFSTPAVADGMVFVGCDNLYGNSLFAFDEDTGIALWNKSVGLVGGSSPVVYDGKVFVVVKDQSPLSLKGDVKLLALYENNGTICWNKTLAKNVPAFESLPKGLHFYNLMATSTPAIKEDANRLFVTSPDGKAHAYSLDGTEIWNASIPSTIYGVIPTYSCTSPVVANNTVYVTSANGVVYALNISDGGKIWEFNCEIEDPELLAPAYIFASPIVADGLLYVSVTDDLLSFTGRLVSIGNYTPNKIARVVSKPIHIPTGKWWDTFNAVYTTPASSSIVFSILDENYNVLLTNIKGNGSGGNISDSSKINSGIIRLSAQLTKKSSSPTLDSWSVKFKTETTPPEFYDSTFEPSPTGWINTDTPKCEIKVHDRTPGLDVDSARYQITYTNSSNKVVTSNWIKANCTGVSGTTKNQTMTADISTSDISKYIADLKGITLSIKDLAGNEKTITKQFKKDKIKPSSYIEHNDSYKAKYNSSVVISANASDPGVANVNKSGVKSVTLKFRQTDITDDSWIDYNKTLGSPYEWTFEYDSGAYEFCTVAEDHAGNVEDLPTEGKISFSFDMTKPYAPELESEYIFGEELPSFSIKFEDDYLLKTVEYRLDSKGLNEWTKINANDIESKTYTGKWSLPENDWAGIKEGVIHYIYFRLTDSFGNQYNSSDDDALKIIKDLTVARTYLDLSDFKELHFDNKFAITAKISTGGNVTKAELYYRYSSDKENWSDWEQYGNKITSAPFTWSFTASEGSGYYEFKTKLSTNTVVLGYSQVEPINVTLFPMTQIIVMILLAFILFIVTTVVLVKMKKKKI